MTCIKKFLYSAGFVFLFSVFTVFGISPNTNATSISANLDPSSLVTSSFSITSISFSSLGLDVSQLDSSKRWIYTLSGKFTSPHNYSTSLGFNCSGTSSNYGFCSSTLILPPSEANSSSYAGYILVNQPFNFSLVDSGNYSSSFNSNSLRISYIRPAYANQSTVSSFVASASDFVLTISDEVDFSPSGSLEITENGTFDVTSYAEAVVNVPTGGDPGSGGSNYHDDLVSINNSIIICAGVALVIYFFYAIYRMMFKGVKS